MTKKPLIMDVDTGSDDAVAILMAVLSEKFDILGFTITQGNRPLQNCTENTLRVLDMLGANIPVYPGCPAPMVRNMTPGRNANNPGSPITIVENGVEYGIHPAYLNLPAATSKPQKQHACSFILDTVKNSPDKVTIIAVGPPTNIGMAFRMDPTITENIEEVVFMGGGVHMGNITTAAEANFFHDPEAIKIVLDSGIPVRIIPINATHAACIKVTEADELTATGTKAGKLAGELIRLRADASRRMGWHDGTEDPIHDALAVAAVIDPTVITDWRRQTCNIDIGGGASDGELLVKDDPNGNVLVAYNADQPKFYQMMLDCVKKGN